jgi:hypothetical protein
MHRLAGPIELQAEPHNPLGPSGRLSYQSSDAATLTGSERPEYGVFTYRERSKLRRELYRKLSRWS